jgi:hypothetical protein
MTIKKHLILSLSLASILWGAVGCALMQIAKPMDSEHYPYHGVLVDTNGVPINPPRW